MRVAHKRLHRQDRLGVGRGMMLGSTIGQLLLNAKVHQRLYIHHPITTTTSRVLTRQMGSLSLDSCEKENDVRDKRCP